MGEFDSYIFVTPVYFYEMSESAKTFFDRLKRCDAFNDNSKIKGKKIVCIAGWKVIMILEKIEQRN